jgi:hypothetical protein
MPPRWSLGVHAERYSDEPWQGSGGDDRADAVAVEFRGTTDSRGTPSPESR